MTATGHTTTSTRLGWVDRLRGLAIVLMVLDHALVVVDPGSWVRLTATRLALPLFMLCAATVWRSGLNRRRFPLLLGCLVVEVATFPTIGIPLPGIMSGIVALTVLLWAVPQVAAYPWTLATVGFIGWIYLGSPEAAVFAWWGLGRASFSELDRLGGALPAWLGSVGRHPLGWYAGHLSVLAVLVEAVGR